MFCQLKTQLAKQLIGNFQPSSPGPELTFAINCSGRGNKICLPKNNNLISNHLATHFLITLFRHKRVYNKPDKPTPLLQGWHSSFHVSPLSTVEASNAIQTKSPSNKLRDSIPSRNAGECKPAELKRREQERTAAFVSETRSLARFIMGIER